MKHILALDQSTNSTGFSYFNEKGKYIKSGLITATNIEEMFYEIEKLINKLKPNIIVIEDIYFSYGSSYSFKPLANLQGLIISICYKKNIPFEIVAANTWKSKFGIKISKTKRNEQKQQCKLIVKEKYNIDVNTDEADAIGIGYWYFNK